MPENGQLILPKLHLEFFEQADINDMGPTASLPFRRNALPGTKSASFGLRVEYLNQCAPELACLNYSQVNGFQLVVLGPREARSDLSSCPARHTHSIKKLLCQKVLKCFKNINFYHRYLIVRNTL